MIWENRRLVGAGLGRSCLRIKELEEPAPTGEKIILNNKYC